MSRPLPPPSTPPVPLASLLARRDLGLRQLAGPREGVTLHWVHTSEMADPVPYLLGGELLLTAGVHLAEAVSAGDDDALDAYLDGYAARTVAAGAAALGFGIAPVHRTVPRALVDACERHGLPLVEVPEETPFTAVESAVWQAVTEARHRELTRIGEAQRALAAAAARPEPAAAVLRALARHAHGWAALLAPDGTEHGSAGARPAAACRAAAVRLAGVVATDGPASAADSLPGTHLTAYGLTGGQSSPKRRGAAEGSGAANGSGATNGGEAVSGSEAADGSRTAKGSRAANNSGTTERKATERKATERKATERKAAANGKGATSGSGAAERAAGRQGLALVVATGPDDPPAHTIAGVAAVLLSLITGPSATTRTGADSPNGPPGAELTAALTHLLLGARPADVAPLLGPQLWTVVHAAPRRDTPGTPASLAAALNTPLVAADPSPGGALRALAPADHASTDRVPATLPGWTLGISAPVPVAELPTADRHAATALRRALARRTGAVRHHAAGPPGVRTLIDPTDAQHHARSLLSPLLDSPPLLTTLHNWLALHGSWDRTATTLGIHRNTVRQRITRIATLLDTDLDAPDARMELWFALRTLEEPTDLPDAPRTSDTHRPH
ncbi:PucR family transcriptional regulator ligand-binding domain-containing protein [Streptomyces sp. NPDC057743]|uniref:PucR family transcriptional regulator ligand-binding domain-containing protein n=1 Tax=Streptomyces sp. NPDC057743 TaxID=3346236 RepID=UPI0036885107